ncbi:hypothetical protein [Oceanithermus sp.]
MVGYILSALLAMMPLPGLSALPDGAEVRIVSPDLRTVYLFWLVEKGNLKLQARPLPIPEGSRVRLLIRTGRELHAYEGRYVDDDVFVETPDGFISLKEAFADVYKLKWPSLKSSPSTGPASGRGGGNGRGAPPGPGGNGNGYGGGSGSGKGGPGGSNNGHGNGKGRNRGGTQSLGVAGEQEVREALPVGPLP